MSFTTLALHPHLLQALEEKGFLLPTAIQRTAIPILLQGKDVLASAVTGSGKTAAFLLPLLHQWMGKPRGKTRGLVLVPTRELAVQISEHFQSLARHTPFTAAAVYGGVPPAPQAQALRLGVDLLIATPGRLLDHMSRPYAVLDGITHLVLDEADRMLDMGFLPDIRRIFGALPGKRQTMFFSATLPPAILRLAREMLDQPVSLTLSPTTQEVPRISQKAYAVKEEGKPSLLLALLAKNPKEKVLLFTRTKHRADRLARFLEKNGLSSTRIHGNLSQPQRSQALKGFKEGRFRILVATDVAARGIDVEAIGLVGNVDVPLSPEDYLHRIGRTGRAGAAGSAVTLYSPQEEGALAAIEKRLGQRLPREVDKEFYYKRIGSVGFDAPLQEQKELLRSKGTGKKCRRPKTQVLGGQRKKEGIANGVKGTSPSGGITQDIRKGGLFGISRKENPRIR